MTTKPKAKKFRIRRSSPLIETDHGAERAPSAEDYRAASQAHERQQAAAQPASTQQQAARPRVVPQANTVHSHQGAVGAAIDRA